MSSLIICCNSSLPGMLFSLRSFANKISPTGNKNQYLFYKTNKYALHMMETLSGLKFVLNTSPAATGVLEFLQQYYLFWVEYATSNFLWYVLIYSWNSKACISFHSHFLLQP